MERKTTYILLVCLVIGNVFPLHQDTLLCFKKNGSVSMEMDQHCCHGHDDHESGHPDEGRAIPTDSDCLASMHIHCCIDVALNPAELDTSRSDSVKYHPLKALRSTEPCMTANLLARPTGLTPLPLTAHCPATDTVVLRI